MAQLTANRAGGAQATEDYDAICRVLQLYIDGASKGDRAKLEEAFHPDSRMFGSLSGGRADMPIAGLFDLAVARPGDTGKYQARIACVAQVGDAATATVIEDGYWGSVSFVDFFSLCRFDGAWKIVSKTFAHTGGEVPA